VSIELKNNNNESLLVIDGELTIYTVAEYRQLILDDFNAKNNLEVDLSSIEEIDTSGLQMLVSINKQLLANDSEMKIVLMSDIVKSAFETAQLLPQLTCATETALL